MSKELDDLVASMLPWQRAMYEQAAVAMDSGSHMFGYFGGGRQGGRTTIIKALKMRADEQKEQQ